ncbi:MAG: SgcJ/EcaC family oxidoreductase, partial [Acetobacteraceae bacterium]|nr:SgcJ/EcaC family oxidoreductase [Acetobacteraceae bacterium]
MEEDRLRALQPGHFGQCATMMHFKSIFMSATVALLLRPTDPFAEQSGDVDSEETIRAQKPVAAIITDFIHAWNTHDAEALARVFTEDGDFVGIGGTRWHGHAQIERVHAELFA